MLFWLPLQALKTANVEELKRAVPLMPTWSWLKQKEKPHRLPEPEDDLTDCCNACAALKYSDSWQSYKIISQSNLLIW